MHVTKGLVTSEVCQSRRGEWRDDEQNANFYFPKHKILTPWISELQHMLDDKPSRAKGLTPVKCIISARS